MKKNNPFLKSYKNLKVLVTGSTGFKGSWLCFWLHKLNSRVVGVALKPEEGSIIFKKLGLEKKIKQVYLDITNFKEINKLINKEKPDIIFHLAAQSIVSYSYEKPLKTMKSNVMGSANILEAVRLNKVNNLVYITSDKCYFNDDRRTPYYENDILGGEDPYSISKACAELVFQTYNKSFFKKYKGNQKLSYATTRAGNVIGGGDMKKNRIVPDVIKSFQKRKRLIIRSPEATRPWQHVMEPLSGYLTLGHLLINKKLTARLEPHWNFGPNPSNCKKVIEVVKKIISVWDIDKKIFISKNKRFKESKLLMLSNLKAKKELNWSPRLNFSETIELTVDWYKALFSKKNIAKITADQIDYYPYK